MKLKVVLIVAVILGLVTSGIVYYMMADLQTEPAQEKGVPVVVATKDIKPRQKIKANLVQIKRVPKEMVHDQAVTEVSKVTGKLALKKIITGEQVLKPRVLSDEELKSGLAFNLNDNQRAVTIAIDEVIGVAGFLTPGDFVDVIGVFTSDTGDKTVAKTVLQNIKVLAVAQDMVHDKNQEPKVTKSVTLATDLDEAEKLILADDRGDIRLALRSAKDKSKKVKSGIEFGSLIGKEESIASKRQETKSEDQQDDKEPANNKQLEMNSDKANSDKGVTGKERKKQKANRQLPIEVIRGEKRSYTQVPVQ